MNGSVSGLCRDALQVGVSVLAQSTLLLTLGLTAAWLLRRHGPAFRAFVLQVTLAGVALGTLLSVTIAGRIHPVWGVSLPATVVTVTPAPNSGEEGEVHPLASPQSSAPQKPPTAGGFGAAVVSSGPVSEKEVATGKGMAAGKGMASHAPTPETAASLGVGRQTPDRVGQVYPALAGLWGGGSILLLLWLTVCQGHLVQLRRGSRPLAAGPAAETLARLAASQGVRPPLLLASPHVRSPFLAGILRPAILLPEFWEVELDAPTLQAVLAHELAHHARRDCAWTLLLRLTCAPLWVQPLLWLLGRQMEQASEEACDLLALSTDCPPRRYADCLLSLADHCLPTPAERALGAGVVPVRSSLGRRIQNILDRRNHTMPALTPRLRLAVVLGTVSATVAALSLVSASVPANTPKIGSSLSARSGLATWMKLASAVRLTPQSSASNTNASLAQAKFLAGLTPVQGPGIIVTLNDSKKKMPDNVPSGMTPPNLIHDTDINQIVNELKAAGAEAISVNDQRLVATSAVRSVGPDILINNVPQAPPYVIQAIGNPHVLQGAIGLPGGVATQIRQFDPAMMRTAPARHLTLPAFQGSIQDRYARPVPAAPERKGQSAAGGPVRNFSVMWRAPRQGTHHLQIYTRDVAGQHLVFDRACRAGQSVEANLTAVGQNVSFLLYDNGRFLSEKRFPELVPSAYDTKVMLYPRGNTAAVASRLRELLRLERLRDQAKLQLEAAREMIEVDRMLTKIPPSRPRVQRLQNQLADAQVQVLQSHAETPAPSKATMLARMSRYVALHKQMEDSAERTRMYPALMSDLTESQANRDRAQASIATLDAQIHRLQEE